MKEQQFDLLEKRLGVSRRQFLKFFAGMAATMGLPGHTAVTFAETIASTSSKKPVVIWLHGQECTGPSESLLRAQHPTLERLILELISLEYHQTLDAGAGHHVEEAKEASMAAHKGQYLLVVEGSVPTKDGGIYCKIANKTMLEHTKEAAEHAGAIIAFGSCASWGGVQSSGPNPTGAVGAQSVLPGKTVVNIPGCPPNPYNFLATVLHFVTFGKLPELDDQNRPKFAYGRLIHENCERRPHFDAGRFATEFGDEGHRKGWCLYKLGCKGPETHANCPAVEFNDVGGGTWPIGVGHPCFGCVEHGTGFTKPLFSLATVKTHTPPNTFPLIDQRQDPTSVTAGAAALAGAAIGAAIGVAGMAMKNNSDNAKAEQPEQQG